MIRPNDRFLFGPDDPMNFLHLNDRLFNAALRHGVDLTPKQYDTITKLHKEAMNIPVLDLQGMLSNQEKSEFQDTIEALNLKLLDSLGAIKHEQAQNARLRQSINGIEANWIGHTTLTNDRNAAVARCTSMESQVKQLETNLKTEVGNRDHFRSLVAQQDAFIKEAKRQILEFKSEASGFKSKLESDLKTKTGEAEHLAKQAIRLNEENSKLLQETAAATSRSNQLNTQTPLLVEENRKFREQTARLIEEKRKLQEQVNRFECEGCRTGEMGAYCGGCAGCLMRQAEYNMNETNKELRTERSISSYKDSIIELLTNTLWFVHELPIFRWRLKVKLVKACTLSISALNGNIDNIRKHQIDTLTLRTPPKKT